LISVCSSVHPVLMMSADLLSVSDAHAHRSGRQYASCLARQYVRIYDSAVQSGSNNAIVLAYMPEKMPSTRLDDAYAHTCVPPKVPQLQEITGSSLALSVKRESAADPSVVT